MNAIEIEDFIATLPDKQLKWKSTTSRRWKKDLVAFLQEKNVKVENCLEIGCNQGVTTQLLSKISDNVFAIEFKEHNVIAANERNAGNTNVTIIHGDAYSDDSYTNMPEYFDVVVIDCIHDYKHVIADINRALTFCHPEKGMYLVFDDYSHPGCLEVNQAINKAIEDGLKFEAYIGHEKGHVVHRNNGTVFELIGNEGIILSYGI